MSDHETTLREHGRVLADAAALLDRMEIADPDVGYSETAKLRRKESAACRAGADALRREDALRGIIESGIVRYKQNGGCSNCGGTPHTATCLVGQLEPWLDAPTEPTR